MCLSMVVTIIIPRTTFGIIVVIIIISKDSLDHPLAVGFRRVLLLLGGESLFCLPPYTEPTHYYPTTTLQTDAIKCISARCN